MAKPKVPAIDTANLPEELQPLADGLMLSARDTYELLNRGLSLTDNFQAVQFLGPVKVVGAPRWQYPRLLNGWVDYTPRRRVRYRKQPDGLVLLEGSGKLGTVSGVVPAFILPSAYRPDGALYRVTISNGLTIGILNILEDSGEVRPEGSTNAYFNFSAQFYAADPTPGPTIAEPLTLSLDPKRFRSKPKAVFALTGADLQPVGPVAWNYPAPNTVRVTSICGMVPDQTQEVTFLVLGG